MSFHLIITDPTEQVLGQELPALVEDGYTSFKVFMTYEGLALSDREMLEVMSVARETGALVMVHAENYDAIRFLTDRLERAGKTAPHYHATSRPIPVEREATHRAISLAELVDVPVMIVHVSNREAMEEIRRAQQSGLKVYGETCPQYLVLTEKDLEGLNMEGAKYVCSPPPRDKASQEACWEGLQQGVFSVFSSDHCPFRYDDPQGKLHAERPHELPLGAERHSRASRPACRSCFRKASIRAASTSTRFVALTSTNHAKTYGLYPRKGTIAVGSDADIAIWDPDAQGDDLADAPAATAPTTRPTRASRSPAGRSRPWCAAGSSCATASSSAEGRRHLCAAREVALRSAERAAGD